MTPTEPSRPVIVLSMDFQQLLDALARRQWTPIGPVARDGAVVLDRIHSVEDLPVGLSDEQDSGRYRLVERSDRALFGFVCGPQSWKKFLFPPRRRLWSATRDGKGWTLEDDQDSQPRFAFIGVRACDLHAIAIQDKVFLDGAYADSNYRRRREGVFIVAVQCVQPGGTCFCSSMGTGPRVGGNFDLALTEVCDGDRHHFVVTVGSDRGGELLQDVPHRTAADAEIQEAEDLLATAAEQMGRSLDTSDLKNVFYANLESPRWDDVGRRCLSCANCTLVCPTCFCSTVDDVTSIDGRRAWRERKWDSCYTLDFSYIHGGSVRVSAAARYRQWITHKLASWQDQFGTSGCVGCGRCITWCPVGIDITHEAGLLRQFKPAASMSRGGRKP